VPEAGARIERTFLQSYGSVGQTLLDAFRASNGSLVYENRWWWGAGLYSASRSKISIDNTHEGIASEELLKALLESIATLDAPEKLKVATALGIEPTQLNYATISAFAKPVGQVLNTVRTAAVLVNPGAAVASGVDHLAKKEYLEGGLEILGGVAGMTKGLKAAEAAPEAAAVAKIAKPSGSGDLITIFHGTDVASATSILKKGISKEAARALGGGDVFWTTTDLATARLFAKANPKGGAAAVVGMTLSETSFERLLATGAVKVEEGAIKVINWDSFNQVVKYGRVE